MMEDNKCVMPDYEAECKRLTDENHKLKCEVDYMRDELRSLESEAARMRAQLDMVYLIFGGRNR